MTKTHLHRLLITVVIVVAVLAFVADAGAEDSVWISPPACQGSIAECMTDGGVEGGEFEMDSESNRRILAAARRHIGYASLSAAQVPCSQKGVSYYNKKCEPGKVNPYNRGCSKATKCRTS